MSEGQQKDTARSKMLNGSAWMTAGNITSRILGAIYIIPWVTWLGAYSDEANALYAQGYNIYNLFQLREYRQQFQNLLLTIMG